MGTLYTFPLILLTTTASVQCTFTHIFALNRCEFFFPFWKESQ